MNNSVNSEGWIGDSGLWETEGYQQFKIENFELLDKYLKTPPKTILDIGCGLAFESRLFNEKYGSELWLLDGDANNNTDKHPGAGTGSWHNDANEFLYYHTLDTLDKELKKYNTKNYNLVDCNNINIPEDVKFDLITSWVSCGFHYPISTYRELIKKHSHKDTVVVMDLRIKRKGSPPLESENVEIVSILNQRSKYITADIKVK